MPAAPTPPAPGPVRHVRQRRSSRRYLYYSAIFCALALIAIPRGHEYSVRVKRSRTMKVAPSTKTFDLFVSEVGFREEGGKPYIAGILKNESKTAYRNVQILLLLRNASGAVLDTVPVDIKEMKAQSAIDFRTPPLPPGTARFSVRDLSGTAQ